MTIIKIKKVFYFSKQLLSIMLVGLLTVLAACSDNPDSAQSESSELSQQSAPTAQLTQFTPAINPSQSAGIEEPVDTDLDGVYDQHDNCALSYNPDQADNGSINTQTPDGIGDACQCGDVSGDGVVDGFDSSLIKVVLLGIHSLDLQQKCNVNTGAACDNTDAIIIERAMEGLPPGVKQLCPAAVTSLDNPLLGEWQLVWSDEFDGTELNLDNWEYQIGDGRVEGLRGWGNDEEQYYTESAVSVAGGNLLITSMAENPVVDPAFGFESSYDYSSGRIRSQGNFDFTYGRVEARIQMPADKGLSNAFSLLASAPSPYGSWAATGELNIVEAWQRGDVGAGIDPLIGVGAFYGGAFPAQQLQTKTFPLDFFTDFHVYALEWDAQHIRWFIDGQHIMTLRADSYWNYYNDSVEGFQPGGESAPFDQNFHLVLNAAVGGVLPLSSDEAPDPIGLNAQTLVDYVRVYQCPFDLQGGTGCKNSIDISSIALDAEFPPDDSSAQLFDLFLNGPDAESLPNGRELALQAQNGLVFTEQVDSNDSTNTYLDIFAPRAASASNVARLSVINTTTSNLILSGFTPQGLGDIKFDIYVESDSINPNGNIRISIVSGDSRSSIFFPLSNFAVDTWERVSIPIQDILTSGPNSINLAAITELVRFEFSDAHVRLDNIQLACGGGVCGFFDEVPVYVDGVDPLWDRGIIGNDSTAVSMANADYSEATGNHVSWREIDTGDPLHNTVVETTFGATGAFGATNLIRSNLPVPSIAALGQGELSFDIRMISNPNNVELLFKVDADGSTTGEQPLGNLPIYVWTRFTCPIETLAAQGLDLSRVTAPFVLVPGNQGAGQNVVVQWDNITFRPITRGSSTQLNLPLVFDFLPGFCLPIQPFAGGAFSIAANPESDAINSNSRVGKITKFDPGNGARFGGVVVRLNNPVIFAGASSRVGKAFTIKTFSTRVGMPVSFRLETTPGIGPKRVFTTTEANAWEEFTIDFNGEGAGSFSSITIIIDDGIVGDGSDNFTLYIDGINQVDSTSVSADLNSVYTFDDPNTTYALTDFGEARSSVGAGPLDFSGRPYPDTNGLVGQVRLESFATSFAGTILGGVDGFANPIPFAPARTTIRMRVWTPAANTAVELRVEDADDPNQFATDTVMTSGSGWQTLDFDFSGVEQMETFEKLILVFAPGAVRAGIIYYWDDIELLGGG